MKYNIITVTGYSCAGKTTIITELKQFYNCIVIKFGEIHKETVKKSEYNYAKDWIKAKGFEEYERCLVRCFIDKLQDIKSYDGIVIIDGIFSEKCFSIINEMENINLVNIVIEALDEIRVQRMMNRENMNYFEAIEHLKVTDRIKTLAGLSKIISQPTYKINGNEEVNVIKQQCVQIIAKLDGDKVQRCNTQIKEYEK